MSMTLGQYTQRLRKHFEREIDTSPHTYPETIMRDFDQASLRTLVEAYEGNSAEPEQESPQKRAARTRARNRKALEKQQTRQALAHVPSNGVAIEASE